MLWQWLQAYINLQAVWWRNADTKHNAGRGAKAELVLPNLIV